MSVDDRPGDGDARGPAPILFTPRARRRPPFFRRPADRPPRPRIRKLRLFTVLIAFSLLALVSIAFGVLTSVASDLPHLSTSYRFRSTVDSYVYDVNGDPIGVLAPPNKQVLDGWRQISRNMDDAIVSVEDKRFWTDPGIDIRGLLRAGVSDLTGGPKEGASTIAEEFVKVVEAQEGNRTIFEKLREAALAFQLTHHWTRQKILTQYLNTIYFGNGAYGVESAARVYFGWNHGYNPGSLTPRENGCGDPDAQDKHRPKCAAVLEPWEAALLAGMVANPYEFDPILHPKAARGRRNLVLQDMLNQGYINEQQYNEGINAALPTKGEIQQPQEPQRAPYFTAWVRPQIVRAVEKEEHVSPSLAQYRAYYGGLKIRLTLDLKLQDAAQKVVDDIVPANSGGPTASLVAIDNATGEVRAMVSGNGDYAQSPFNLATLGYRQPGSSFKMFTLAAALSSGKYGPDSYFDSKPLSIPFRTSGGLDHFNVRNFGNEYAGPTTLANATATSDNSVFAQLGMAMGTKDVKKYAKLMGVRSSISTTPAMILGGLRQGVSALDMAHAYETVATGGLKVYNPVLGDEDKGPVGIHSIYCPACKPDKEIKNKPKKQRVLSPGVAESITGLLRGVVSSYGTAPAAAIPGVYVVGKTGTTSNYVDAWFVGWTPQMTVAVWVGYANSAKPMLTSYRGGPMEGGDYPAMIWHNFMVQAIGIQADEQHKTAPTTSTTGAVPPASAGSTASATSTAPSYSTPQETSTAPAQSTTTTPATGGNQTTAPVQQTPTAPAQQTPTAPVQQTPTAPAQQIPTAPAQQTPTAPAEQTPTAPQQTPTTPVTPTPAPTPTSPATESPTPPATTAPSGGAGLGAAGSTTTSPTG